MARFFNKHSEYEDLLTEHLDGRLDAAGEVKLRAHAETCAACAADLREMAAVKDVLRAQPMVEAPRSFALPLNVGQPSGQPERVSSQPALPGFIRWAGSGSMAMLRTMQMATAAAALVLVALVGLDVSGVLPALEPQVVMMTAEAPAEGDAHTRFVEPGAPGTMAADDVPPDAGGPSEAPDITTLPPQPGPEPAAATTQLVEVDTGRTALEWAKVALSGVTALLALGVVGLSWAMYRHPV